MQHQPRFDDRQREKIRSDLLNYKLAYGIGAPRMATLISQAHPNKPHVDYRRVARFLTKKTVPEDMFLSWCELFLQSVPPVPAFDPARDLAKALIGFSAMQSGSQLAGSYSIHAKSIFDAIEGVGKKYSQISITADDGFCRVQEVDEWNNLYDGVLVETLTMCLAFSKDRLTGSTKIHVFYEGKEFLGNKEQLMGYRIRSIEKEPFPELLEIEPIHA